MRKQWTNKKRPRIPIILAARRRTAASGAHLGLYGLAARDRPYVGRDSIKTMPHGSKYRAIHGTDVTFEFEYSNSLESLETIVVSDTQGA